MVFVRYRDVYGNADFVQYLYGVHRLRWQLQLHVVYVSQRDVHGNANHLQHVHIGYPLRC